MRDFKFRAWDKISKQMTNPLPLERLLEGRGTSGMDLVWMQYTGLKDKNGKEIFEGDVVIAWSQGSKGTFEVRFRQEAMPAWILYPAWQHGETWKLHGSMGYDGCYHDTVEVIGNIYENPGLIPR